MTQKKYCEDCKWFSDSDWCCNPAGSKHELVMRRRVVAYCYVQRSENGECGPDGRMFEKKRSFWRDLFSFWNPGGG